MVVTHEDVVGTSRNAGVNASQSCHVYKAGGRPWTLRGFIVHKMGRALEVNGDRNIQRTPRLRLATDGQGVPLNLNLRPLNDPQILIHDEAVATVTPGRVNYPAGVRRVAATS